MRLLHQRHDHAGRGVSAAEPQADRRRNQEGARAEPLSLRHARANPARGEARFRVGVLTGAIMATRFDTTEFNRRDFLKTGGVLMVTFAIGAKPQAAGAAAAAKTVATDQVDGFLA